MFKLYETVKDEAIPCRSDAVADFSTAEKIDLDDWRAVNLSAKGRKPRDLRKTLNGIWWILCTGSIWNQLPSRYGKWNSVWRCYRRWCASGMWNDLLLKLASEFEEVEKLHIVDASHCKCHQDAARSPQSAEEQMLGKTNEKRQQETLQVLAMNL